MMNDPLADRSATVRGYFEENHSLLRMLWAGRRALAFHMGFWDEDTKSKSDALINENRFVASLLPVGRGRLIDLGCGIGGTAIWVAETLEAPVVGVDFVAKNIQTARRMALHRDVGHLTEFALCDATSTPYLDGSFVGAYSIESYGYVLDREGFFSECNRLLEVGGVLVIADYFRGSDASPDSDCAVDRWLGTWGYQERIPTPEQTVDLAQEHGLRLVDFRDMTGKILPSSILTQKASRLGYRIKYILHRLGLHTEMPDAQAVEDEVRLFTDGAMTYGVMTLARA